MATIKYKGFEVSPASHQLRDSGEWTLDTVITKHHDSRGETLEKKYSGKNTFKTEAEANAHSIEFGKQIIDGKFPEFTTDYLL
jgi:hypothetical protein